MNRTDRRKTLAVLAAALASPSIATGSPRGTFLAQAGLQTDAPGSQAPPSSVQPAAVVNGTYQAAYQDGYAPALLEIGFSEDVLLEMFSSQQQRMTINATSKTLWLQTPDGPLNSGSSKQIGRDPYIWSQNSRLACALRRAHSAVNSVHCP